MTEKSKLLVLRLEGLLQSWGDTSKWDDRDSQMRPTKSGIVGLLACAMGFERESLEIQQLSKQLSIAVRADRAGMRMIDFQTVTGNPLIVAQGGKREGGSTFISRRTYIQDASFLVALETSVEWYERILNGLRNPKWSIYLGCKNCVPSRPVLEDINPDYDNLMDIILHYPVCSRPQYPMIYECPIPNDSLASMEKNDERLSGYRKFTRRRVWYGSIKEKEHVPNSD